MDQLIHYSPKNLEFLVTLNHRTTINVSIENVSEEPAAFKVKTTKQKRYCVRPNAAVLQPAEKVTVEIVQQALKFLPKDSEQGPDRFLLMAVSLAEIEPGTAGFEFHGYSSTTQLWKNIPDNKAYRKKMAVTLRMSKQSTAKLSQPPNMTISLPSPDDETACDEPELAHNPRPAETESPHAEAAPPNQPATMAPVASTKSADAQMDKPTALAARSPQATQRTSSTSLPPLPPKAMRAKNTIVSAVASAIPTREEPMEPPAPKRPSPAPVSQKSEATGKAAPTVDSGRTSPTVVAAAANSGKQDGSKAGGPIAHRESGNRVVKSEENKGEKLATQESQPNSASKKTKEIDYTSSEFERVRVVNMRTAPKISVGTVGRATRQRIAVERASELNKHISERKMEIKNVRLGLLEARHKLSDARRATSAAYDVEYIVQEKMGVPVGQIAMMVVICAVLLQLLI